jgi:hypothetical protein
MGKMLNLFPAIKHLDDLSPANVRQRYGLIETARDQLVKVQFRPWPKLISAAEVAWIGGWKHERALNKRCRLYFNQPLGHSNYLTIPYIESTFGSSFRNLHLAMKVLDLVVMQKRCDAILCELSNERISDRLMVRWGWERHLLESPKRHWIKRFYGDYSSVELAKV